MGNSVKALLDIFIITYNRANKLESTLQQVFSENSPIKDFEITIIDNNSTDNTPNIIKKYQEQFPNIIYKKNKYNIGGNANIARTFEYGEKKYIWILCDDDYYNWDSWNEVENAIHNDKDAVFVSTYERPFDNIAQMYMQATFLPSLIYKKSLIDETVLENIHFNISNMFPHLAVAAKLINEEKDIEFVKNEIVNLGVQCDESTYTRGCSKEELHPLRRYMSWLTGYANSILMIKDKSDRKFIYRHNKFGIPLNSPHIFWVNSEAHSNNFYNLCCIYNVLNVTDKIKFIVNLILFYSLYHIIYFYKNVNYYPQKFEIVYSYRVRLFGAIKIKIFSYKRQLGKDNSKK